MSTETGGAVFRVDRGHSLDDIFKEIQDEMRAGNFRPQAQATGGLMGR